MILHNGNVLPLKMLKIAQEREEQGRECQISLSRFNPSAEVSIYFLEKKRIVNGSQLAFTKLKLSWTVLFFLLGRVISMPEWVLLECTL